MPRLTGRLGLVVLDVSALTASLDKELTQILVEGTVEWVRTVSAIIPNWSGESRASLQKIADLVDVPIFAGAVSGAPDRTQKGFAEGEGDLILNDKGDGVYAFVWHSNVFHLAFNESNNANQYGFHLRNPGPYHSMRQAQQSFYKTVNPRLRALGFGIDKHLRIVRKVV